MNLSKIRPEAAVEEGLREMAKEIAAQGSELYLLIKDYFLLNIAQIS